MCLTGDARVAKYQKTQGALWWLWCESFEDGEWHLKRCFCYAWTPATENGDFSVEDTTRFTSGKILHRFNRACSFVPKIRNQSSWHRSMPKSCNVVGKSMWLNQIDDSIKYCHDFVRCTLLNKLKNIQNLERLKHQKYYGWMTIALVRCAVYSHKTVKSIVGGE